ncbi:MAG: hypothetical protein ABMA13_23580 [Chthoniobacteraceae bacterium]
MLAKAFGTTPEWVMWNVRFDRGLLWQHALLRAKDQWTVPLAAGLAAPRATAADFDTLLWL